MSTDKPARRLGRGLDALLGERTTQRPRSDSTPELATPQNSTEPEARTALRDIPISAIRANPYQPRKEFSDAELKELADSIRSAGLLQPIAVRTISDGYELVAGERRLRAIQSLGWPTVPAIVRDYDDRAMLTLALIENLQRADLNPIEEAEGYARLADEFNLTQIEIADLVGKDRSTVANLQRVLQLPEKVRRMLETGELSLGHARPLLALQNDAMAIDLATEAVAHGLSVRAMEERVRQNAPRSDKPTRGRPRKQDTRTPEIRHVEDLLRKRFQTDISLIRKKGEKGELRIQFYSTEDLNRLLEAMQVLD